MIRTICYTLGENFLGYKIYKEQVMQIERPAFFVRNLETVQVKRIGNLYRRQGSFVVRCHLEEDTLSDYEALTAIADKLYKVLEYMEFEGRRIRGMDMKHRIEDNVLQFFVTCTAQLKHDTQDPAMEKLKEELRKKG